MSAQNFGSYRIMEDLRIFPGVWICMDVFIHLPMDCTGHNMKVMSMQNNPYKMRRETARDGLGELRVIVIIAA